MPYKAYEYSAFICYHQPDSTEPGRQWAQWIQQLLENYPTAPEFAGKYSERYKDPIPHRMSRVFLDRAEVSGGGHLPAIIEEALQKSRVLIVLCSPAAVAKSTWMPKEITAFKKLGRLEAIIAVVLDGEPYSDHPRQECYPAPLRHALLPDGSLDLNSKADPAWIDFRGPENTLGATSPEEYRASLIKKGDDSAEKIERCFRKYTVDFEEARIRLLAGVLGLPYRDVDEVDKMRTEARIKEIRERDEAEKKKEEARAEEIKRRADEDRQRRKRHGVVLVLALITIAALAVWGWRANNRVQSAMEDVRVAKAEKERAEQQLKDNIANSAKNTRPLSSITEAPPALPQKEGPVESLSAAEKEALDVWSGMIKEGDEIFAAGQTDRMVPLWTRAVDHAQAQLTLQPTSETWLNNLVWAYCRLGECWAIVGKPKEAAAAFAEGVAKGRTSIEKFPANLGSQRTLAMVLARLGISQIADQKWDQSAEYFKESLQCITRVVDADKQDSYQCDRAFVLTSRSRLYYAQGYALLTPAGNQAALPFFEKAIADLEASQAILKNIPEGRASYLYALQSLNSVNQLLGITQAVSGKPVDALQTRRDNVKIAEKLVAMSRTDSARQIDLSRTEGHLVESLLDPRNGNRSEAPELLKKATGRLDILATQADVAASQDFRDVKAYLEVFQKQLTTTP